MYPYKLLKDDKFSSILKESQGKLILPKMFILLGIFNIVIFNIWSLIGKVANLKGYNSLYIFIVLIIIQLTVFKVYYNKYINKNLEDYKKKELTISFSEDGINISQGNSIRHINWKGVKEIRVYNDFLTFIYNVNGISGNMLLFDGFEVEKDEIITEIEKYKAVRWC